VNGLSLNLNSVPGGQTIFSESAEISESVSLYISPSSIGGRARALRPTISPLSLSRYLSLARSLLLSISLHR
jgi:hypothetical protein